MFLIECHAARIAATLVVVGLGLVPVASLDAQAWPYGTIIENTFHNFSHTSVISPMSRMIAAYDRICVYCHAPHNTATNTPPLSNRPEPMGPYTMYTSPTIDMPQDPQPTGVSQVCLSCHDSTIGLDDVLHQPRTFTGPKEGETIDRCASCHSGKSPAGGFDFELTFFGTDLSNHHPFSLLYDPAADPDLRSIGEITTLGIRLYDGRLQCASCHDPHSQQYQPFLRVDNTGGAMCATCHLTMPAQTTAHFWP